MEEALSLAMRGRGEVEPNPRVGALALRDGEVVGRGFHRWFGAPHAEVEALADARARGARADTVVVNLEPCSTPEGVDGKKTPPCTRALLAAGISRVVIGMRDPDPRHHGRGVAELAAAGVEVVEDVLGERCRAINAPFARGLALDRPWTISKWAMTLDGKTAAANGTSKWISGEASRRKVHELRSRVDAVVIGARTARVDDPELTVRHVAGEQPARIVVDPGAQLDERSRLVQTIGTASLWILTSTAADPARLARLRGVGVQTVQVPPADAPDRLQLAEAWRELRRRGLRRVLFEGGGGLAAQLMAADCIDQVQCFIAPKLVGGRASPSPLGGVGRASMAEAWRLEDLHWQPCGEDLLVGAFVVRGA
jgi:diaminohydroxyphosphoribosylaminopyrimidine deaminase/5-amino-6-(5-phosphoribosylamino)uracil reductase